MSRTSLRAACDVSQQTSTRTSERGCASEKAVDIPARALSRSGSTVGGGFGHPLSPAPRAPVAVLSGCQGEATFGSLAASSEECLMPQRERSISSRRLGRGTPPQAVDEHSQDDDYADDDLLVERRDMHQCQAIADDRHQQGTNDGSHDRALATEETGAADNHRRDSIELGAVGDVRLGGVEPGGQHEPGDTRGKTHQGIDAELIPVDVYPGEASGLLIAADRVGIEPESGVAQNEESNDENYGSDDDGGGDTREVPSAPDIKIRLHLGNVEDGLTVCQLQGNAAKDLHGAERNDEWWYAPQRNDQPVHQTAEPADEDHGQNDRPHRPSLVEDEQTTGD